MTDNRSQSARMSSSKPGPHLVAPRSKFYCGPSPGWSSAEVSSANNGSTSTVNHPQVTQNLTATLPPVLSTFLPAEWQNGVLPKRKGTEPWLEAEQNADQDEDGLSAHLDGRRSPVNPGWDSRPESLMLEDDSKELDIGPIGNADSYAASSSQTQFPQPADPEPDDRGDPSGADGHQRSQASTRASATTIDVPLFLQPPNLDDEAVPPLPDTTPALIEESRISHPVDASQNLINQSSVERREPKVHENTKNREKHSSKSKADVVSQDIHSHDVRVRPKPNHAASYEAAGVYNSWHNQDLGPSKQKTSRFRVRSLSGQEDFKVREPLLQRESLLEHPNDGLPDNDIKFKSDSNATQKGATSTVPSHSHEGNDRAEESLMTEDGPFEHPGPLEGINDETTLGNHQQGEGLSRTFYWHSGRSSSSESEDEGSTFKAVESVAVNSRTMHAPTEDAPTRLPPRSTSLASTPAITYGASALGIGGPSDWEYFGDYEAEDVDDEGLYTRQPSAELPTSFKLSDDIQTSLAPIDEQSSSYRQSQNSGWTSSTSDRNSRALPVRSPAQIHEYESILESKWSPSTTTPTTPRANSSRPLTVTSEPMPPEDQRPDLDEIIRAWSDAPYVGKSNDGGQLRSSETKDLDFKAAAAEASLASTPGENILGVDPIPVDAPPIPRLPETIDSEPSILRLKDTLKQRSSGGDSQNLLERKSLRDSATDTNRSAGAKGEDDQHFPENTSTKIEKGSFENEGEVTASSSDSSSTKKVANVQPQEPVAISAVPTQARDKPGTKASEFAKKRQMFESSSAAKPVATAMPPRKPLKKHSDTTKSLFGANSKRTATSNRVQDIQTHQPPGSEIKKPTAKDETMIPSHPKPEPPTDTAYALPETISDTTAGAGQKQAGEKSSTIAPDIASTLPLHNSERDGEPGVNASLYTSNSTQSSPETKTAGSEGVGEASLINQAIKSRPQAELEQGQQAQDGEPSEKRSDPIPSGTTLHPHPSRVSSKSSESAHDTGSEVYKAGFGEVDSSIREDSTSFQSAIDHPIESRKDGIVASETPESAADISEPPTQDVRASRSLSVYRGSSNTKEISVSQNENSANDPYSDLNPWGRASLNRFAAMLREEARAELNRDKLNIFSVFTSRESRLRVILYGNDDELINSRKSIGHSVARLHSVHTPDEPEAKVKELHDHGKPGLQNKISSKELPPLPIEKDDDGGATQAVLGWRGDSVSGNPGIRIEATGRVLPKDPDRAKMKPNSGHPIASEPSLEIMKAENNASVLQNADDFAETPLSTLPASTDRPRRLEAGERKVEKPASEVNDYITNRRSIYRPFAVQTLESFEADVRFSQVIDPQKLESVPKGNPGIPTSQYNPMPEQNGSPKHSRKISLEKTTMTTTDDQADLRRFMEADFDPLSTILPVLDASITNSEKLDNIINSIDSLPDDFGFINACVVEWDAKVKGQREENEKKRHMRQIESEQRIDDLFNDHEIGYGDIAELEEEFKQSEAAYKAGEDRSEYHAFVDDVFNAVWARLHFELDQLAPHYEILSSLMDETCAGKDMFSTSGELLPLASTMNTYLGLHQKLEIRHQKAFEAVLERDRRLKKIEISPWYSLSNLVKVKQLEKQFADAEKKAIITYCEERDKRVNRLMDVIDQNTLRGVGANQDYMESIMNGVRRVASGRAFASIPGSDLPSIGLNLVDKAHSVTSLLSASSEQIVQTFHIADMLLNSADYEVSVAKAKASGQGNAVLVRLKEERAKEDQKLMRDLEHRLALIRDDSRHTRDEIIKLKLFLGIRNGGIDTAGADDQRESIRSDA